NVSGRERVGGIALDRDQDIVFLGPLARRLCQCGDGVGREAGSHHGRYRKDVAPGRVLEIKASARRAFPGLTHHPTSQHGLPAAGSCPYLFSAACGHASTNIVAAVNQLDWGIGRPILAAYLVRASVPIPKFAGVGSTLGCELRNRRTLATYWSSVALV